MRRLRRFVLWLLAILVLAAGGYAAYALRAYYRLEDRLALEVRDDREAAVEPGVPYKVLSYNIGFGAYSADYSFFMDGGTESRARSREAVYRNLGGACEAIQAAEADFVLLEEVDVGSTRSHQVDEREVLQRRLTGYGAVFAQNYDPPYLLWPLNAPHGKSRAGLLTLSRYHVESSLRRSLPVEGGWRKFLDLDRCYVLSRLPVADGRTLCLYTVHLSAYTADGSVATEQLKLLLADMAGEYAAGNYVICGGDFNKDLLGNSGAVFGVSAAGESWAQPFPEELLPKGISLVAPLDEGDPVPSCRNADAPYDPATSFVLTVDGFLHSDNVKVLASGVVDTGFAWSDHNPVWMTVRLG